MAKIKPNLLEKIQNREEQIVNDLNIIKSLFEAELAQKTTNRALWKKKYAELRAISKNSEYFKLEHINKLNLPYNIVIIVSKKGIGKTKEIYRLFQNIIDKDEKLFYMRHSDAELRTTMWEFSEESPLQSPLLIEEKRGKYRLVERGTGIFRGFATPFKSAQRFGGAEFKDFYNIIFDECITYETRGNNVENFRNIWDAFLMSVVRNKKGVKAFLFGNYLRRENTILDYYGITPEDDLVYLNREGCKILYINLRDMYKGVESQDDIVNQMSFESRSNWLNNKVELFKRNIITEGDFYVLEEEFNVIWSNGPEKILFLVRRIDEKYRTASNSRLLNLSKVVLCNKAFAVKAVYYTPAIKTEKPIWCNDRPYANNNFGVTFYDDGNELLRLLKDLLENNNLLFTDEFSQFITTDLYKFFKRKI